MDIKAGSKVCGWEIVLTEAEVIVTVFCEHCHGDGIKNGFGVVVICIQHSSWTVRMIAVNDVTVLLLQTG